MGIVGESLGQAEPTHHAERDVIDNASLAGLAFRTRALQASSISASVGWISDPSALNLRRISSMRARVPFVPDTLSHVDNFSAFQLQRNRSICPHVSGYFIRRRLKGDSSFPSLKKNQILKP